MSLKDFVRIDSAEKANCILSFIIIFILVLVSICLLIFPTAEKNYQNNPSIYPNQQKCLTKFPFLQNNKDLTFKPTSATSYLSLTPYIHNLQIHKAKELAFVGNWNGIESYSGYFTVNEKFQSNLFFWFFPCECYNKKKNLGNDDHDHDPAPPLLLYLQGGPSLSSLLGLFLENGPFRIGDKLELSINKYSWTKSHSMLYIDSPVDSGYSFTKSKDAYAKNQEDVSRDLYEALIQFFTIFPEYCKVPFYIVGTSYAAKYVPALAYKIHITNQKVKADNYWNTNNNPPRPQNNNLINLQGLAIGSGFFYFNALIDGDISNFYYNIGFLDINQFKQFQDEEKKHRQFYENGDFKNAREVLSTRGLLHKFIGFNNFLGGSALNIKQPQLAFQEFLNDPCIQSVLHVGNSTTFSITNYDVFKSISDLDYMTTPKFELETLLNARSNNNNNYKYRVLIYNSQFDVIIPQTTVAKFIYNLTWNNAEKFKNTERKIWSVKDNIAGFVIEPEEETSSHHHTSSSSQLTMVLIRNAGHAACYEQPEWCLDMINKFTNGISFVNFKQDGLNYDDVDNDDETSI